MTDSAAPRLHVQALSADWAEAARHWAERLGLPLAADDQADFAVQVGEQGLQVLQLGPDSPGPVRVTSSRAPALTGASSAAAAGR